MLEPRFSLMKQKRYGPHSQNGKENIMKKKKKPLFVVDVETTIVYTQDYTVYVWARSKCHG